MNGMYRDLAKWMPEFHKTGAGLFIQLTAEFGRYFTISPMMETLYTNSFLRTVSKQFLNQDRITATASPTPNRWSDKVPSRELTAKEIKEYARAFAITTGNFKEAGVDGVEIVRAIKEECISDKSQHESGSPPRNDKL